MGVTSEHVNLVPLEKRAHLSVVIAFGKPHAGKKACGTLWVLARSEGAAASGSKLLPAKHLHKYQGGLGPLGHRHFNLKYNNTRLTFNHLPRQFWRVSVTFLVSLVLGGRQLGEKLLGNISCGADAQIRERPGE